MRVLFYQFFPAGGIGRYTHVLSRTMDLVPDVSVEVACPPDFHHGDEAGYALWPNLMPIGHSWPPIRKARFLVAQWVNPFRLLRYAKATQPDIVHFSNINHLTYRFWRSQVQSAPYKVAASAHDIRRAEKILSRRWESKWLRQFYLDADALFVHSEEQKRDLEDYAPGAGEHTHLVPHGPYSYADPRLGREKMRESLGVPEGRRVGLFFGIVRRDKNLEGLLRAVALVTTSRPYIVVAGKMAESGEQSEAYFAKLIEELGLSDDVRICNRFIEEDEVGDFYSVADFSCLPYLRSFTSQSGVLNVAAYFGCPVLTTPAPTLAETVGRFDLGVRCSDDRPREIAEGITQLLDRLDRHTEFDFAGYRQAHSWETNVDTTIAVYRRLLSG